jgi:peptidoglycan hydrolase-like protein with peptidoglycan-binding domain
MKIRSIGIILWIFFLSILGSAQTRVGIRGTKFTINGEVTYTAASGFPAANQSIEGTLLNVRAVQAIFDDANYPRSGTRAHPYDSVVFVPVSFDYPDTPFSPERNLTEFLKALPSWRKCGVLAITVNLQGGGPTDGNFGVRTQPQNNNGFDAKGNLKPAYAKRLQKVIEEADKLGMIVIVGYFYQGTEARIDAAPQDANIATAIGQASSFLLNLPHRNILIEVANEVHEAMYPTHPLLQPDGIDQSVHLAQEAVHHEIPVSFSWIGDPPPRSSRGYQALRDTDFVMFHTNWLTPEGVHTRIQAYRQAAGYDRAFLINEDEVSTFNLQAATQEHVGWGYYDQGLNNYHDGFQSVPVDWKIGTLTKWMFFDQVARLTGSPEPAKPASSDPLLPTIRLVGMKDGDTIKPGARVEAVIEDHEPRWPIRRVEFFLDGVPYSYVRLAPFYLGGQRGWDLADVPTGHHTLWVVAYDPRGPDFTEVCSLIELQFTVLRPDGQ